MKIRTMKNNFFMLRIKKKVEVRRAPGSNSFLDDDLVIVPSLNDSSDFNQDSSISSRYVY